MKNQSITCNIRISTWQKVPKEICLLPEKNYTLKLDYPLEHPEYFSIESGHGKTFDEIVDFIVQCYRTIYKSPDSEKDFGVWGHGISDLWIERVEVNHKANTISVAIGS